MSEFYPESAFERELVVGRITQSVNSDTGERYKLVKTAALAVHRDLEDLHAYLNGLSRTDSNRDILDDIQDRVYRLLR